MIQHIVIDESKGKAIIRQEETFVFVFNNVFYMITYVNMGYLRPQEFVENFILGSIKNMKIKEVNSEYTCFRGCMFKDDFNTSNFDFDKIIRKTIWQTNYFYRDNAGRMYAVMTKVPYTLATVDNDKFEHSYEEMKSYIIKYNKKELLPDVEKLYKANISYDIGDAKYISRTSDLIKLILQQ